MSDFPELNIEDKNQELEVKFSKIGQQFLRALYSTFKTAVLYDANNNRYISQVSELRLSIAEIFTEDKLLSLVFKNGFFFLNNFRIALDKSDDELTDYFKTKFEKINIEGFNINSKADAREIDKFIFAFTHFKADEEPYESFRLFKDELNDLNIENVIPTRIDEDKAAEEKEILDETSKIKARKIFFNAISVVQEVINQAKSGNRINLAKTKRVVQSMVDQIIDNESALTELTVLRDFDNYTYIHSTNVCIYSLILGYHLNLDKKRLSDLGVGALLHDIGKVHLPVDLVNKPTSFDEMDWQMMKTHPVFGVKAIIKTRGTDRSSVRAIAAAYEHHLTINGEGYPELLQKRAPCLFAQIIAITDTFDAMTSGRVYHKVKMTADEVITNMVNRAGSDFDPLLLKVFINTIGIYPIGSVVQLNTEEVAIVSRNNPSNPEHPEVKIIADRDGLKSEVRMIDLSSNQAADIHIKKIIDEEKYNINPANYIDFGE